MKGNLSLDRARISLKVKEGTGDLVEINQLATNSLSIALGYLVKKNGYWRFYVNCRASKKIIVHRQVPQFCNRLALK